jgi:hypothetical protein
MCYGINSSLGVLRPAPTAAGVFIAEVAEMIGKRALSARARIRLFPLLCALFFPLLAIVLGTAAFLSPSQGLTL